MSNVTAAPVTDAAEIRENLVAQLVSPVLWAKSMQGLIEGGADAFTEPGPGTVLAGLMKKIDRSVPVRGYPDADSLSEEEA